MFCSTIAGHTSSSHFGVWCVVCAPSDFKATGQLRRDPYSCTYAGSTQYSNINSNSNV